MFFRWSPQLINESRFRQRFPSQFETERCNKNHSISGPVEGKPIKVTNNNKCLSNAPIPAMTRERLQALYMKHHNNTHPNLIMHICITYLTLSLPHPCIRPHTISHPSLPSLFLPVSCPPHPPAPGKDVQSASEDVCSPHPPSQLKKIKDNIHDC